MEKPAAPPSPMPGSAQILRYAQDDMREWQGRPRWSLWIGSDAYCSVKLEMPDRAQVGLA